MAILPLWLFTPTDYLFSSQMPFQTRLLETGKGRKRGRKDHLHMHKDSYMRSLHLPSTAQLSGQPGSFLFLGRAPLTPAHTTWASGIAITQSKANPNPAFQRSGKQAEEKVNPDRVSLSGRNPGPEYDRTQAAVLTDTKGLINSPPPKS